MTSTGIDANDEATTEGVRLLLDRDFLREGFNADGLDGEGLTIGFSERLGADPWFIAVVVGMGWRTFDALTKNAASRAVDRLLEFTQNRDKKLKMECEARNIDPRVETLMASISTASRSEFDAALRALPVLKDQVDAILQKADDPIRELYFVWQEDHWQFSYYISVSGDVIESV